MADTQYLVEIVGDIKDIKSKLSQLESRQDEYAQRSKSTVDKVAAGFSTIAKRIAIVTAAFATAKGLINTTLKWTRLAREQQKVETQLSAALEGRSQALLDQASALQAVTTAGDEQIIQQQAFLANLDFTESQIQEIIPVALDLAAATGQSLEFAVRNLAKTYSGLTGELGELIPQLRDLSAEELKAGGAVRVSRDLFAGQAAAAAEGLGVLEQTKNVVGDLGESLGTLLSPVVIAVAKSFQFLASRLKIAVDAMNTLLGIVKEGPESLNRYREAIELLNFEQLSLEAGRLEVKIRDMMAAGTDPAEIDRVRRMQEIVFELMDAIQNRETAFNNIRAGISEITDPEVVAAIESALRVAGIPLQELPAQAEEFQYTLNDLLEDQRGMVNVMKLFGDTASRALLETDNLLKALGRTLKSVAAQALTFTAIWSALQFIPGAGSATGGILQFLGNQLFGFSIPSGGGGSAASTVTGASGNTGGNLSLSINNLLDGKQIGQVQQVETQILNRRKAT